MANVKYFNGDVEFSNIRPMDKKEFANLFGSAKSLKWDSFSRMVGEYGPKTWNPETKKYDVAMLPVERAITYKSNPSKHKCSAKCTEAKGFLCECECGGKNHGAGNFSCD